MADLAAQAGAPLAVASAPGARDGWRLAVVADRDRVLLVDDHRLVRAGLARCSTAPTTCAWSARPRTAREAVRLGAELRPDVILMDLSMPVMDGVEATREMLAEHPDAQWSSCSRRSPTRPRVNDALRAGAVGYLLKDCDPRDLLAAVRSAAEGHAPLDPRVARSAAAAAAARRRPGRAEPRERRCCGWSRRAWRTSRSAGRSASASAP